MSDKSAHLAIAEEVVTKVKKAVRDKLSIEERKAYSAIADQQGWIVRLTPRVLEANKKRLTEGQLESAGLHGALKDGFHRAHHLGIASGEGDDAKVRALEGAGLEEVVAAVEVGAKAKGRK